MSNNEINWEENEWFAKYHLQDCTDEFKKVWVAHYGHPYDYVDGEEEYWIRCAFFLFGWRAHHRYLEDPAFFDDVSE